MSDLTSKILLGGGLLGAFYLYQKDQAGTKTSNVPLSTEGDQQVRVLEVAGITSESIPDYKTWTRGHWREWMQALYKNAPQIAKRTIWGAWQSDENEHRTKFPAFITLATTLLATPPKEEELANVFQIDETSSPVYDTWTNWYNNIPVWQCGEWIAWFDSMERAWGIATARQRWLSGWEFSDNWSLGSNGWSCSQDCDFISKMASRGLDVADWGMWTLCSLSRSGYNIVQTAENVSKGTNNVTKALSDSGQLIGYGLGAAGLYWLYKQVK